MKRLINYTAILILLMAAACKKEAALTPTEKPEDVYGDHTLPQGNHPYDADIVAFFKKYNTLILYKYKPNDLYHNQADWLGGAYDATTNKTRGGLFDVPSEETYVGKQLDLMKEVMLKFYPDDFLLKGLPKKVFLVDSFFLADRGTGTPQYNLTENLFAYTGSDFLLFTYGGSRIETITQEEKNLLKGKVNTVWLSTLTERQIVKRQSAFHALTDYNNIDYWYPQDQGIIDYYKSTPEKDWNCFVETIVSKPYSELIAPGGELHPSFDTKGLIRKKYDILINYFRNAFGIDLQAIGNAGH